MCRTRATMVAVIVLVGVGCGGGGGNVTAPSTDSDIVSTDAMADLVMVSGQMSEGSLDNQVSQMERVEIDGRDFIHTRDCPAGGEIRIEGTLSRRISGNVTEIDGVGTRTESDCVHARGDETITVNGTADWESHHRRVGGEPTGNQTTHWRGTSTFRRSDGSERTCRVEFTLTRNPTSGRRDLEGTICGRQVSRSGNWDPQ